MRVGGLGLGVWGWGLGIWGWGFGDWGFGVEGLGFGIWGLGVWGVGIGGLRWEGKTFCASPTSWKIETWFGIWGLGSMIWGLVFKVSRLGLSVGGVGFRVQGTSHVTCVVA